MSSKMPGKTEDIRMEDSIKKPSADHDPPHRPLTASEAFDKILSHVGDNGRWQWKYLVIFSFCGIFTAFHNMGAVFLAATPDHWCQIPGIQNSTEIPRNLSIPWYTDDDGTTKMSQCKYFDMDYATILGSSSVDVAVLRNGHREASAESLSEGLNRTLNETNLEKTAYGLLSNETKECSAWIYDRSVHESTVVSEWNLVCGRRWLMSSAQATYMGGILTGAVVLSELSDRFGRRPMCVVSAVGFFVASVATAFSDSYLTFLTLRFLVAMFGSGMYLANFVNLLESVGQSNRSLMGIYYHITFSLGFSILVVLAYFIRDWRTLQLATSVPTAVLLLYYWMCPESSRWLMMEGRVSESTEILQDIASTNGGSLPPQREMDALIQVIKNQAEQKEKLGFFKKLINFYKSQAILLRTPNMRRRCLIMYFCWFVVSMLYYGLTFSGGRVDVSLHLFVAFGSIVEYPSIVYVCLSIKKLGMRTTSYCCFLTTGVACLLILAVPAGYPWMKLTLSSIGKLFISSGFGVVFNYSAELFPTYVRNIAVGTSSMWARVGSSIAPYIVDLLGDLHYAIPSAAFGGLAILAGLLSFLLPDTSKMRLPETIEDVEALPR